MSSESRENRSWLKAMEKLQQDRKEMDALLEEDLKPSYLPNRTDAPSSNNRNHPRRP